LMEPDQTKIYAAIAKPKRVANIKLHSQIKLPSQKLFSCVDPTKYCATKTSCKRTSLVP